MRAALHVASLLDAGGSTADAAHESYWRHATGGVFPPSDLELGERLLVSCGLVGEREGTLYPSPELIDLLQGTVEDAISAIAARAIDAKGSLGSVDSPMNVDDPGLVTLIPNADRRQQLLLALGQRWDAARRLVVGAIGEEVVANAARDELEGLGHVSLARQVLRVSLVSDQLGYDISAPRIVGASRLLEVKATTATASEPIVVHMTRNEAEVGLRFPDQWALVVCSVSSVTERSGEIVGWCNAHRLESLLPLDTAVGRWEAATLHVGVDLLEPGLPRPTL